MPGDNLSYSYKLGFVAVGATMLISVSEVNASCLPTQYYGESSIVSTQHSWENNASDGYYTFQDGSGKYVLSSFLSKEILCGASWLLKASELDKAGNCDEALDVIYDNVDNLLTEGNFSEINKILGMVDITGLSDDVILGILTSTLPARDRLENREYFFQIAKKYMLSQGKFGEEIFAGLD